MKNIIVTFLCLLLVVTFLSCNHNTTNNTDITSSNPFLTTQPLPETTTIPSTDPVENPATDFQYELSPSGDYVYITRYVGASEHVVIPSEIEGATVTSLVETYTEGSRIGAFEGCNIKTVLIPSSVVSLGSAAFKNCTELTEVTVAENSTLQLVGVEAFSGCVTLTEIDLPDCVREIGERAFYECSSLLEIHLPQNLQTLGKEAFVYCTALRTVTIPVHLDLYAIDSARFAHNPLLEQIIFEEGREEIKGYAFFAIISNAEITIPSSVKRFSTYPFFIYSEPKLLFGGNCPEIIDGTEFRGNPIIYYNPSTDGWEECPWKNQYTLTPIE